MHYVLKDLSIDLDARTVLRQDTAINLTDLSFDVLAKLIEAAPEPVSIADFCKEVWHAEHVSYETAAQRITLLRKALGDSPKKQIYIRTVRGAGYAIVGPILSQSSPPSSISFLGLNLKGALLTTVSLMVLALTVFLLSTPWKTVTDPDALPASINQKSIVTILIERGQQQLKLHQAQETDRAISILREALELDPVNFDGRLTLSFALSTKATKFGGTAAVEQEAESLARDLINERPDNSNAWSALGYSLGSQGRGEESLSAYQYAFQLNPQNTAAISSAAYVQLIRGNLYQALLLEVRAKQTGGTSRYAEIQIAQILELIGHPAAQKWQDKALSLNPGQVVILSEIARSYLRQGNPLAALEILSQAKGDDQTAPQILQLRGRASLSLGNMKEARSFLKAAENDAYYDIIALNAHMGDTEPAKALFLPAKLAVLESDSSPETRIHLAEITAALGQKNKAMLFLAQAINLGWRDLNWLKQSPYLSALMSSQEGHQIEDRIVREVDAQRRLIEGADALTPIIEN